MDENPMEMEVEQLDASSTQPVAHQAQTAAEQAPIQADYVIVGAGYAGLTAARRLVQAGSSVVVLEARDRVGGRVYTGILADGSWLDFGGTWFGPPQKRAYALAEEMCIDTYPTYNDGEVVLSLGGTILRLPANTTSQTLPGLDPTGGLFEAINAMARQIPLDAPWEAPNAAELDAQTMATWIEENFPDPTGTVQAALTFAANITYSAAPAELSPLFVLYHLHSCYGIERLLSVKDGFQQDRVVGGMQAIVNKMAAELGRALHLNAPVRQISQDDSGVIVTADAVTVQARRVIVALPPTLASHIEYDPPLSADRALLLQRITAGWAMKAALVYDEPFWRADGLTGQSFAPDELIGLTLDGGTQSGPAGILLAFAVGPAAQQLGQMTPEARKAVVLDAVTTRFGARAASPTYYAEHEWAAEEWTRGCYLAHYPPGVMTSIGALLRVPEGRIHWAGTETSAKSNGTIDGAIISGERAANEVQQAESLEPGSGHHGSQHS
jgi:monoamine oxidase